MKLIVRESTNGSLNGYIYESDVDKIPEVGSKMLLVKNATGDRKIFSVVSIISVKNGYLIKNANISIRLFKG